MSKIKNAVHNLIETLKLEKVNSPIIDNRLVNDHTFALRLKLFLEGTETNDLPGEEEKEYLLNVANKLIDWQKLTVLNNTEKEYLKRNNVI